MTHEEICTYEVAKLAKEKGFPQHIGNDAYIVDNEYDDKYEVGCHYPIQFIPDYLPTIVAPTQSLLQRWLRDTHAIDIDIYPIFTDGSTDKREYGCQIYAVGKLNKPLRIGYAKTYENMLDKSLKYALENLVI